MDSRASRVVLLSIFALGIAACGDESEEESESQQATAEAPAPDDGAPIITGSPALSVVAGEFYEFIPSATDPDGDPIVFGIDGLPGWLSFDQQTGRLFGTPALGDVGVHSGIFVWVSDGQNDDVLPAFDLEVLPPSAAGNQPPEISGTPAGTVTAGDFYDFIPTVSDPDGDSLSFQIINRPAWASFDQSIGRLSGTPGDDDAGVYSDIVIRVRDGVDSADLGPFVIAVNEAPVTNSPPTISGIAAPDVQVGAYWSFQPQAQDTDGDPLSFEVFNLPSWASFSTQTGFIDGTPGNSDAGIHAGISIVVSDGQASAALPAFSVEVIAPNTAPTISGTPATTVSSGQAYSFTPTASDPDGDSLTFTISNRPVWAQFNASTGALSGTPNAGQAGTYNSISITVSDGDLSDTLGPFSIQVQNANAAPVISGTPAGVALAGQFYSFTPEASDPDDDTLSFTVQNLPVWASFDSATGQISGTPGLGNVGNYPSISITVSDGVLSDTLGPFAINVTATATGTASLTWSAPTENTDGSPLTDLAGFRVYWGTAPGNYSNSVTLNGTGTLSYVVENLVPGTTYFFATTAFNSADVESGYSNEASKTIP